MSYVNYSLLVLVLLISGCVMLSPPDQQFLYSNDGKNFLNEDCSTVCINQALTCTTDCSQAVLSMRQFENDTNNAVNGYVWANGG